MNTSRIRKAGESAEIANAAQSLPSRRVAIALTVATFAKP